MRACCFFVLAACGRIGFEPASDAPPRDAPPETPSFTCADMDLGSALGPSVLRGTTVGAGNDLPSCTGIDSEEVALAWTAPSSGLFRISTCSSSYNTTLLIAASCGALPAGTCANDVGNCLPHEIVDLSFSAGERVVIVIDGNNSRGPFVLDITQR
jgi:hypothetical protein